MIRQGDLKFMRFSGTGEEILFDLAQDPGETKNVLTEPAYARAVKDLRQRMDAVLADVATKRAHRSI